MSICFLFLMLPVPLLAHHGWSNYLCNVHLSIPHDAQRGALLLFLQEGSVSPAAGHSRPRCLRPWSTMKDVWCVMKDVWSVWLKLNDETHVTNLKMCTTYLGFPSRSWICDSAGLIFRVGHPYIKCEHGVFGRDSTDFTVIRAYTHSCG